MEVTLIDSMGSDLTVVNAARVSMDKESFGFVCDCCGEATVDSEGYCSECDCDVAYHLSEKDSSLISYLAKHNHWTPFSHCSASFRIKAPIFVARQLFKHKIGLTENEISRRYVDTTPELFKPTEWRKLADNVKQGSSDEVVDLSSFRFSLGDCGDRADVVIDWFYEDCLNLYTQLLEAGVCPEQARMVLPQAMYTEWYWTGSMSAFARVCKLRLDPHAQKETQMIAKKIYDECSKLWPESWKALMNES